MPKQTTTFPQGGTVVKNPPANAGDTGLIPGSGRSLGEGNGNPLQYFCREIPWTEEPGRLQSTGSQRVGLTWRLSAPFPPNAENSQLTPVETRITLLLIHWYTTWNLIQTIAIDVLISEKTLTPQEHSKRGNKLLLSLQFPEGVRIPPRLELQLFSSRQNFSLKFCKRKEDVQRAE